METRLTFRAEFSAATKRHGGDESHLHGHTYAVAVTTLKTLSNDWQLPKDLRSVLAELDGRQLEDMMRGGSSDVDSVAAWIMERLLLTHSGVVEVSVTEDGRLGDVTATAVRPIRAPIR